MNLDALKQQYNQSPSSMAGGIIDVTWAPRMTTMSPPDPEVLLACGANLVRNSGTWYIEFKGGGKNKWSSDPMARHIGATIVEAELLPYMGNVDTPIAINQLTSMGRLNQEPKPTGIGFNGLTAPLSATRMSLITPNATLTSVSGQVFIPRLDTSGLEKTYGVQNVLLSTNATSISGLLAALAMSANPISKEMLDRAKSLPKSKLAAKGQLPIASHATGLAIVVQDNTAAAYLAQGLINPDEGFVNIFNSTFGTQGSVMPSMSYKVSVSDVMAGAPASFLDTTMCPAWLHKQYGPTAEQHQGKPLDQGSQMGTLILINPQVANIISTARMGAGGAGYSIYI